MATPATQTPPATTARALTAAIAGLGTAVPPRTVTQAEALAYIQEKFGVSPAAAALYRRVLSHPGIATRHVALDELDEVLETDHDRVHARYARWARRLGAESLRAALADAHLDAGRIGFLATTTCTGSLCPGLSSYVAEDCGLPEDLAVADLAGMGCGAALPALRGAADFVAARPGAVAAVVCAEVSTAAMFNAEEPGLIISNAIFADGAAAAIVTGANHPAAGRGRPAPRLAGFASLLKPAWRDVLRFRQEGGRLRNVLGREVPDRTAEAMAELAPALLAPRGLGVVDIRHWLLHAGGATVLDALEKMLALPPDRLASSRAVLRAYGNMSSPTVLFALKEELTARSPDRGALGILASFGAGFSAHAALLEF